MSTRIVILGGGTGGTLTANRLRRHHSADDLQITVVDQDNSHVYQPGLLFVPFGMAHPDDIVRPRARQLHADIDFVEAAIHHVDLEHQTVYLSTGALLAYDLLVIATGARLVPEETQGLTGPGWMEKVFTFYTPEGAAALDRALARFEGGHLVVNVVDMPIKCPVAPLEFIMLADWFFHEQGIRDRVELIYATPLPGAFTKPIAAKHLGDILEQKGVRVAPEFMLEHVDPDAKKIVSYDEQELEYDLLVSVPLKSRAWGMSLSRSISLEKGCCRKMPKTRLPN